MVFGGGYLVTDALAGRVVPVAEAVMPASPAVPVLSARRTPTVLSTLTRTGRFSRAAARFAERVPSGGCAVVEWKGLEPVALTPDAAVTPASTNKIVTAAVALDVLGADRTFETVVHGDVDASGSASALYLVGGGDPLLVRSGYPPSEKYPTINGTSMEDLVAALAAAGLRSVRGPIVAVDDRYDTERYVSSWPATFHKVEAGPIGALLVNDGLVTGESARRDDPGVAAATELERMLGARGIPVTGAPVRGALPGGVPAVASVRSAPLTAVVQEMLVNSDNNTAEMLLKEMGRERKGQGTTAAGAAVVREVVDGWGLADGLVVVDGSGLSSANKSTCRTLVGLLQRLEEVLPGLLAVAGRTGTLRDFFDGEPVEGRLVGKTGTLTGVKALAGYLPVEGDEPVVFALLMSRAGISQPSAFTPIWNALGDALDAASAAPAAEQLAP
ncbi:MAG: putative D-alanyl-D-alanine carboxypeptidase [Actinomycetota bacterium]|jgi:D-alanyl-D-alanine carboxypeptidase/D-alanyl-D-alanine-endopeptidase (penicillin-binding protein 4)